MLDLTWLRTRSAAQQTAARKLIAQLEDPNDPTALVRRLGEVHRDATRGFGEMPADPSAAVAAAELYSYLTEI